MSIFQYKSTELVLKGNDGSTSKITVTLKYIPVKMTLDPSESINNMGTLRVDVLDAADLPAADRNGYSDPYCKFNLNGKEVYKTKIQKKTLHPAWNEFFECPVSSRIAAQFKVKVMDWDFGEKADLLGEAVINLELLDPFKQKEVVLGLDGKSGALRLKLLFRPDYVMRSRQGSSTFSGTFATPGKVIGAPVKGVGLVGGVVGGGVLKGASFLRHGFRNKKEKTDAGNGVAEFMEEEPATDGVTAGTPQRANPVFDISPPQPQTPVQPFQPHNRSRSFGGTSVVSATGGMTSKLETGTATFTVLSASGFPPSSKIQVHVKQLISKGAKEVHKTKPVKTSTGEVQWEQEFFRVSCTPDTQFQVQVKDDKMFGGEDLGEALFVVDDSSSGGEKSIKVGEGEVIIKTAFVQAEESLKASPRTPNRKSFLSRREKDRDTSRANTPN